MPATQEITTRSLHFLGAPEVRVESEVKRLSRQHQRLLAVLVAAGPVGMDADRLLEELYVGRLPRSRTQAIYSLVSRLDDDASPFVVNDAGRYRIADDVEVDAWLFDRLAERDDAPSLVEGLQLWRGRPFDTIEAGPVLQSATEHLRRSRSAVAESTAKLATREQLRRVERQIHDSLDDDPYNEPLAIATAGALYRLRKRRDALSTVQSCRARLRRDLGLDGSAELDGAELALLRDADPLGSTKAIDSVPVEPPGQLPSLLEPRAELFVGRGAPFAAVREAIVSAGVDRRGRVVLVSGAGGMGKSELVSQVAAASDHCVIRAGGFSAASSAAYAGWLRALPELRDDLDALGRAPERDVARLVFWQSVERTLGELASVSPLLVVLEDMHDCDPASAALFGWLSSAFLPAGVVLAATTRAPVVSSAWDGAVQNIRENAKYRVATVIDLEPLTLEDVASMVGMRFPTESPARIHRFASQVHALSHGNPLVGRSLVEEVDTADDLVTTSEMTVDDHHARAVQARVDGVVSGVLTNAGLIGHEFDLETLAELCEMTPSATLVHLETAMSVGLVIETETLGHFRFDHVKTMEAFAQRASRTRRTQTFQRLAMNDALPPADRVRYVRGAGDTMNARDAAHLLQEEGVLLISSHEFAEARAAFEHAVLRLTQEEEALPFELLLGRAEATAREGDVKKLVDYRREAFEAARTRGDGAMVSAALVGLPASERAEGDPDLLQMLEEVHIDQINASEDRGRFLHQLVRAARLGDRPDLARETIARVGPGDIESAPMRALFESERVVLDQQLGHSPGAAAELGELIEELPVGVIRTQLRHRQFLLSLTAQDPEAVTRLFPAARAESLDQPVPRVRWGVELAEATLFQVGMYQSALDPDTALATGFRLGISDAFTAWGAQTWQKMWIAGEFEGALKLLEDGRGIIPPNSGWLGAEALALAAMGRRDESMLILDTVASELLAHPSGLWATASASLVVETCEQLGEPHPALDAALDALRPHSGAAVVLGICAAYLGPADGFIGRGLRLLGSAESAEVLDAARDQASQTGSSFWVEQLNRLD